MNIFVTEEIEMDTITLTKKELKELLRETVKETLAQLIVNKPEMLEYLEDYYLGKLMQQADNGELVEEKEVLYELRK